MERGIWDNQKQSELLFGNSKTLGETCKEAITKCQNDNKQCLDVIKDWKKHSSELQKSVNSYVSNCSVIQEIRDKDYRKTEIESKLSSQGYTQQAYETWRRQSADFQAQILSLQQKLMCEQN